MSDSESNNILKIEKKFENNDSETKKDFYVSGIFYIGETNWTIWINGIAYSEVGQHQHFSIDEVEENQVTLTLKDGSTINLSVNNFDEK